jgi:fructose-1,6-bisphosphatase/inositol monophosphatase family enzyme
VRRRTSAWRRIVADALGAAAAVVRRLAPAAGQHVVGGREAGYRGWDPEVIGVDTAAERAVMRVLRRAGVRGRLLSEEAGEVPLDGTRGVITEPVYVVMDPFDGSMLYRRGIRAHWFTALGIYGEDGRARAAGLVDHVTGERVVADGAGASRTRCPGARSEAVRPSKTRTLEAAYVEAYLMKPAFLYPTATALRPLLARARFVLPNGGPGGFVDVACGRIDVYVCWREALTEVFSAVAVAERAGARVSHWDGTPLRFRPDLRALYSLVCSANARLHAAALRALRDVAPPEGVVP